MEVGWCGRVGRGKGCGGVSRGAGNRFGGALWQTARVMHAIRGGIVKGQAISEGEHRDAIENQGGMED